MCNRLCYPFIVLRYGDIHTWKLMILVRNMPRFFTWSISFYVITKTYYSSQIYIVIFLNVILRHLLAEVKGTYIKTGEGSSLITSHSINRVIISAQMNIFFYATTVFCCTINEKLKTFPLWPSVSPHPLTSHISPTWNLLSSVFIHAYFTVGPGIAHSPSESYVS